ncbi:hypothetical protein CR513_37366, partial [Mucuna pruriens]
MNCNYIEVTPNINSSIKPKLILPTNVLPESKRCLVDQLNFSIAIRKALSKGEWRQAMKEEINA